MLVLFAVALGLRVLYGAFLAVNPDIAGSPITPELRYAKEIATGTRWFHEPLSPRSPGYPAVLASFYVLSAKQFWIMTFLQSILGALTVVMLFRIGTRVMGPALAVIAALWFAFHVFHMHLGHVFHRDILTVFLLTLLVYLLTRPFKLMWYGLVAGIIYAALIHVDPQFLLLLPVFAAFILFKSRHAILNVQYLFLFLFATIVISLPWTMRNNDVYGQPIPVGLEARKYLRPAKTVVTDPDRGWADIEGRLVQASRARLIEKNAIEFWRFAKFGEPADSTSAAWSRRHNLLSIANYGILIPFFLFGFVLVFRNRNREGIMLAVLTASYFLMRSYLGGDERMRLPVDPFIIVFAFYGIGWIVSRFRKPAENGHAPD
jgi:4-amino-4-deoxy-L-arabinose transferase-like glycosyltransferase